MSDSGSPIDTGRLLRLYVLIASVTAVFLITAREVITGTLLNIATVVVGSIALVTAITGFLIAAAGSAATAGE